MTDAESIMKYKASMSVFRKWHTDGVITGSDLIILNTALAEKYGLSSQSIFFENDLQCKREGVMNGL